MMIDDRETYFSRQRFSLLNYKIITKNIQNNKIVRARANEKRNETASCWIDEIRINEFS